MKTLQQTTHKETIMEQAKQAPALYVRYDVVYSDGHHGTGWTEVQPGATIEEMERAVVQDIDGWYGTTSGSVKAHYEEYGHLVDIPAAYDDTVMYVAFY